MSTYLNKIQVSNPSTNGAMGKEQGQPAKSNMAYGYSDPFSLDI